MFRIGIIGTENTHALAFSQLINLPDKTTGKQPWEDARVVGVYGPDEASAQAIVKDAGAEFVAASPEDFFGRVDAMMITSRKGSVHYDYAMPFIEKGMPVFIDKPITTDIAQAERLMARAKETGALVTGGSGCKYAWDVLMLQHRVREMRQAGTLLSAAINFSVQLHSEYDGFHFYSPHLTEMALTIFGNDVRSVRATEKNGTVVVVAAYDDCDVTLHYTAGSKMPGCLIFGSDRNYYREMDMSLIYNHEVEHFITMLRTGTMPHSHQELIRPVYFVNAVLKSLETDQRVAL